VRGTAKTGGLALALPLGLALGLGAAAPGCSAVQNAAARTATLKQGLSVEPGETPERVREKWGPPARTARYADPVTGVDEEVWEYEQYSDVDRAIVTTRVTFRGGRVVTAEREIFRRTDEESAADRRDRP